MMRHNAYLLLSLALASLALAACGSTSEKYTGLIWDRLTKDRVTVTRDQAAAIPFASIGIQGGDSNQVTLVLGGTRNGSAQWLNSILTVETHEGRIIQTAGFPNNLSRMILSGTSGPPLPGVKYSLMFDIQDLGVFGAQARCEATDKGLETITILGANIPTHHLVEDCEMDVIRWSFENEFWLDAKTGFVWQSVQNVHPKLPPLSVQVFRPPQN